MKREKPVTPVQDAINNAMAHNKYLTQKFLEEKSIGEILCFCHPGDRQRLRENLGLKVTPQPI